MRKFHFFASLALIFYSIATLAESQKLRFATTSWCPYICGDTKKPGFVVEYLMGVFKEEGISASYEILPWARAIEFARLGEDFDALLTVSATEAPDLLMTSTPSFLYQACFYGPKKSNWKYKGLSSLKAVRVVSIKGYGYANDFDEYIAKTETGSIQISDSNGLQRMAKLVSKGRADVFVADSNVASYNGATKGMKQLGCLSSNKVFIAFSRAYKAGPKMVKKMNSILRDPANIRKYKAIKSKYIK